jgi:hypothetical protein
MLAEITKSTTVTFNPEVQRKVAELGTAYEFNEYVHMAVREQITRDRLRLGKTDNPD